MAVANEDIATVTLRGVTVLGLEIRKADQSIYNTRKSIASSGSIYVFDEPSDCHVIQKVWDLAGNAKSITGAANNGSGAIRMTSAAHGFDDDEIVFQHDVGGTIEANDTWKIENATADTYDLVGSTFANTYTSGGKVYADPSNPDEIRKINLAEATLAHSNSWYPRNNKIIVDDAGFSNDIILDYIRNPSALTDIPDEFHEWFIGFGVDDLMVVPPPDMPDYQDKINTLQRHRNQMLKIEDEIRRTLKPSNEPSYIRDEFNRGSNRTRR